MEKNRNEPGLQELFAEYAAFLHWLKKEKVPVEGLVPFFVSEDLKSIWKIEECFRFLKKNRVETPEQLEALRLRSEETIKRARLYRDFLKTEIKIWRRPGQNNSFFRDEIGSVNAQIRYEKRALCLCEQIEEHCRYLERLRSYVSGRKEKENEQ